MRLAAVKKYLMWAGALGLVALVISPAVSADTYPYLKTFGGDVWTGGWFSNAGACTTGGYYQDPGNGSQNTGGISTFSNTTTGGGSSSEFGAFSLGVIDSTSPNGGFYSDAHTANGPDTTLSFANPGTDDGGLFEGSPPKVHCIPDYYGKLAPASATAIPPAGQIDVGTLGNQQYSVAVPTGSAVSISGTVQPGQRTSIYVKGDVYINTAVNTSGITYASGYTESNVPKFALIVKGNIFIDSGVKQMDGIYIAQPDITSTNTVNATGAVWSCYDTVTPSASNSKDGVWMYNNCRNPLAINGALIAKTVNFGRINSDASSAGCTTQEPMGGDGAETINYTPEMIIGGPFFNQPTTTSTLQINDLVSLPPLY